MSNAIMKKTAAYSLAGALVLEVLAPAWAGPMPATEAALGRAASSSIVDVRWHHHYYAGGIAAGLIAGGLLGAAVAAPYYYGPDYYGPPPYPYYGRPVYYAPPPEYYAPPPRVVYAPPPGPNGPVRRCWVTTDSSRGFGFWRPC